MAQHLAPPPRVLVALQLLARPMLPSSYTQPRGDSLHSHLAPPPRVLVALQSLARATRRLLHSLLLLPLFLAWLVAHGGEREGMNTCLLGN